MRKVGVGSREPGTQRACLRRGLQGELKQPLPRGVSSGWSLCPLDVSRECVSSQSLVGGREHPCLRHPSRGWLALSVCTPVPRRLGQNLSYTVFFVGNLTPVFFPTPGSPWERRGVWRAWRTWEERECLLGLVGVGFELFAQLCQTSYSELLSNFLLGELRDFRSHLLLLLHTLCHFHLLLTHPQSASFPSRNRPKC